MNHSGNENNNSRNTTGRAPRKKSVLKKTPVILKSPEKAAALLSDGMSPVFMVRHGQTDCNLILKLQGREDIALNETGVEQANECAASLREAEKLGLSVKKVFTSPLSRAKVTADIISDALGLEHSDTEWKLIERDYGEMSGLTLEERKKLFPRGEKQAKNVEAVPDAAHRMKKALFKITRRGKDSAIAVTHGGIINALFLIITGGRIGTGKNISENCGISIVAVGEKSVTALAYNLKGDILLDYIKRMYGTNGETDEH